MRSPLRILSVFGLSFLLLLLTASCLDVTQHLTLKADGSATITSTLLIDNALLTTSGETVDAALAKIKTSTQQNAPNATITTLKTPTQGGIQIIQTYKSLDAALTALKKDANTPASSSSSNANNGILEEARHSKSSDVDHYTFVYRPTSTGTSSDAALAKAITFHFSLTLPTKIAHSSSTSSPSPVYSDDHRTVTYQVPLDKPTTITVDSEPPFPFLLIILGVLAAILFASLVAFFYLRRSKERPSPPTSFGAPASPSSSELPPLAPASSSSLPPVAPSA